MALSVVAISHLPNVGTPAAGDRFQLVVELDRKVQRADGDVTVLVEKQRIKFNMGGFLELRPTGSEYFAADPMPIVVKIGEQYGIGDDIIVRADAKDPDTGEEVVFPDRILFTPFIGELRVPFTCGIVTVAKPAAGPLPPLTRRRKR